MKQEFIINGAKIFSEKSFYKEVENSLLIHNNSISHWTLDVFDDLFDGGYGLYELNENIVIRWRNYRKSESKLDPVLLNEILEILQGRSNIELIID